MTYHINGEYLPDFIRIRKVREPFGCLGNMSPHPVLYDGKIWATTEALFQALRFDPENPIREKIRAHKNPIAAKREAKARVSEMTTEMTSERDLNHMRTVLALKYEQHQVVRDTYQATAGLPILEDCSNRQHGAGLFWGAGLQEGLWYGDNWLGRLWAEFPLNP